MVEHPQFRNVEYKAAEAELASEEVPDGEVIIRPSSKGSDHLTFTFKFHDAPRIFWHLDVLEMGKRNAQSLGTSFKINGKSRPLSPPPPPPPLSLSLSLSLLFALLN